MGADVQLTAFSFQRSEKLYRSALEVIPGGVNSPVRSMVSIGREPIFIERGEGAELVDVDGNRYVDWVCSWGPLIAGHAQPGVVAAVQEAAALGTSYGAPTAREAELAVSWRSAVARGSARQYRWQGVPPGKLPPADPP